MRNNIQTSFTIDEQLYKTCKLLVSRSDRYTSIKEFNEQAVVGHIAWLRKRSNGGWQCRELLQLLDEIRDIQVKRPEDHTKTKMRDNLENQNPRIEVSPDVHEMVTAVRSDLNVSQSEVIRRCVVRELAQNSDDMDSHWRKDRVRKLWQEVKNGLRRPKIAFHNELQIRFVDEEEATIRKLKQDRQRFNTFAEEYVEEFYESDCYEELTELRGEDVLRAVEGMISRYSSYKAKEGERKSGLSALVEQAKYEV